MTKIYKVMKPNSNGDLEQVYPETSLQALIGYAGPTNARPSFGLTPGLMYFDTTLGEPIWYTGSEWVDATGKKVN